MQLDWDERPNRGRGPPLRSYGDRIDSETVKLLFNSNAIEGEKIAERRTEKSKGGDHSRGIHAVS